MMRWEITWATDGHQAVQSKLKFVQKKCIFPVFCMKLSLCRTAWWSYRLSHIDAICINLSYSPKNQSVKFSRKNIENWGYLKNSVFLGRPFWKFFCKKKIASFLSKSVTNQRVPWMGLNFYYHHDFQKKGGHRIMKHTVPSVIWKFHTLDWRSLNPTHFSSVNCCHPKTKRCFFDKHETKKKRKNILLTVNAFNIW